MYNQNEPKINGVYSTNNLPLIKIGHMKQILNWNQYQLIGNGNNRRASFNAIYFDSFGVEHTPKGIKKFIGNKNIVANIFRIQAYDSIMCGYYCIGFIDFMLKDKSLIDYPINFILVIMTKIIK